MIAILAVGVPKLAEYLGSKEPNWLMDWFNFHAGLERVLGENGYQLNDNVYQLFSIGCFGVMIYMLHRLATKKH